MAKSKFGKGLSWAGKEHKWEKRTNYVIILGIITTGLLYYFKIQHTTEIGLGFLILIGITHLIARFSHKMEQYYLKDSRKWR